MGIAVVDDPAILQTDDAVGLHGDGIVVGDEDDGVALLMQLLQHPQHFAAGVRIQRAGGLVGQDDRRVAHQRPRDGNALLLAAGELIGLVPDLVAQAHLLQHGAGAAVALGAGMPAYTSGTSTFSSRFSRGSRLYCWKIKPSISFRMEASSLRFIRPTSLPLSR